MIDEVIIDRAFEWWRGLEDTEQERIVLETYCKKHNIRIE